MRADGAALQRAAEQHDPAGRQIAVVGEHPQRDQAAQAVGHEMQLRIAAGPDEVPQRRGMLLEAGARRAVAETQRREACLSQSPGQQAKRPGAEPQPVYQDDDRCGLRRRSRNCRCDGA